MFGYWKQVAANWEAAAQKAMSQRDELGRLNRELKCFNRELKDEVAKLWDNLRQAKSISDAADLQLAAERQDNERLKAKLKTLDHVNHCYEQCEADRQALADERDKAVVIAKLTVNAIADMHAIVCEQIDQHFPEPKESTDARADDRPDHPGRPGCRCPGPCQACYVDFDRQDG